MAEEKRNYEIKFVANCQKIKLNQIKKIFNLFLVTKKKKYNFKKIT